MTIRLAMHLWDLFRFPVLLTPNYILYEDILFIYLSGGKNTTEFTNNIVNQCRVKDRKIDRGHIIVSLNEYLENSVFIDQNEVILVTMFSGPSKPLLIVISGYCCTDTVQITELISLLLQHFRNRSMQKPGNRDVCLDFILRSRSE